MQTRKNYARLIEALALLRTDRPGLHLVIAGGRGWLEDPIYAALDTLNLRSAVTFTGFADDADLPVLEAMACGTPVVTSNLSSLPEVAGDAALLIDLLDVRALAEALHRLLTDEPLRAELRARGLARVSAFTWQGSARQLLDVYALMLSMPTAAL